MDTKVSATSGLVALLLLLGLPATVCAQFTYTANNGTITITGYTGPGGAVIIPETIDSLPVTTIAAYAFMNNAAVTGVTISRSVTNIGRNPFYFCSGLTNVLVDPANPAYSSADGVLFSKDSTVLVQYPPGKAGGYTVPGTVTTIREAGFCSSTNLTSLAIPASTASIARDAFLYCTGLQTVTVAAGNPAYASIDGVLFNKNLNALLLCPAGRAGSFSVLGGVTTIGYAAFHSCGKLTSITIPGGVTTIDDHAFNFCSGLIILIFPPGVTSIGAYAVSECYNLVNVSIPDTVTSIGEWAFYQDFDLGSMTIPKRVTNIGQEAFRNCSSLPAIHVDPLNPVYSSVDGVLFDRTAQNLIQCPAGRTGTYIVPNNVTSIGRDAFAFSKCTSITLPASVASIGDFAFYYCSALTGIYSWGNAPGVTSSPPFDIASSVTVYYLPGTKGWGPTFGGRPTMPWALPYPVILTATPDFGVQANGSFGFTISWARTGAVVIEAATSLTTLDWSTVKAITLKDGACRFDDPNWGFYPKRLYRVRGL